MKYRIEYVLGEYCYHRILQSIIKCRHQVFQRYSLCSARIRSGMCGFPDYEKDICELRRNEIATLYDETTKQEKMSEYESFLYEEYLWYAMQVIC